MRVGFEPTPRTASSPLITGTTQYEVLVNDSSASYHGTTDTRYKTEAGGKNDSGAGRGVMRLYADAAGDVVGYTWSTSKNSIYYNQTQRHLVVGRYVP